MLPPVCKSVELWKSNFNLLSSLKPGSVTELVGETSFSSFEILWNFFETTVIHLNLKRELYQGWKPCCC